MEETSQFSRTLAAALLAGRWSIDDLEKYGALVFAVPRQRRWLSKLILILLAKFDAAPRRKTLVKVLESFYQAMRSRGRFDPCPNMSLLGLPRPIMRPAPALTCLEGVPPLTTPAELSNWLGLTLGELNWFADQFRFGQRLPERLHHYRYQFVRKKSGGWRLLEVPKPRLKRIQRQILHGILDYVPPHLAAHAFRAGRSIATYVTPHAGQQVLLHVDLRDFFPTLRAARVRALFTALGYPLRVADLLTALCTHRARLEACDTPDGEPLERAQQRIYCERHLPQGTPTSPAIANLCAYRLDVRLSALARKFGASYTRFADDLLFSGGSRFNAGMTRFRILVLTIALAEGFSIRERKTRVLQNSQSQRVAGVILNEHPNPPRPEFDQLKALLFNCVRYGPESQNREHRDNFAQHLRGRIAYLAMLNPIRATKLSALFQQIIWPEIPDDAKCES